MKKNLLKFSVLALAILTLMVTPLFSQNVRLFSRAASHYENSSVVSYYNNNFNTGSPKIQNSETLNLNRIVMENSQGSNSHTFYLYPTTGGDSYSIQDYFSVYLGNGGATALASHINGGDTYDSDFGTIGENQIIIYTNSASSNDQANSQTTSVAKLSNNLIIAMREGFVSANAYAEYSSRKHYKAGGFLGTQNKKEDDKLEGTKMEFYAYNSGDHNSFKKLESGIDYTDNFASVGNFTFDGESLKNIGVNRLEMVFYSYLAVSGVSANLIQIQNPKITLETSDILVPELSVSGCADEIEVEVERWAKERTLTLNASDFGSGLFKIEVSRDGQNFETYRDFTVDDLTYRTSSEQSYKITENGDYYFRVVDNVGNISKVFHYTEKYIDTLAPNVIMDDLTGLYLGESLTFSAEIDSLIQTQSPETFTQKLFLNGNLISNKPLENTNTLNFNDYGVYTLVIEASDYVKNTMPKKEFTLIHPNIGVCDYYTSNKFEFLSDVSSNGLDGYEFFINVSKQADGTSLGEHKVSQNNSENNFILTENGKYNLNVSFYAKKGEQTFDGGSKVVEIDYTIYTAQTSATNGTISSVEPGLRSLKTITFEPNEGFVLYSLSIKNSSSEKTLCVADGTLEKNANSYTFELDDNYEFSVLFKKAVQFEAKKFKYEYNYGALEFVYGIDYLTNILEHDITFSVKNSNGDVISNENFNAGNYSVNFLVDTDEFYGEGSFEIEITKKQLKITDIQKVYDSKSKANFSFVCDDKDLAKLNVKFYVNGEAQSFESTGFYTYKFSCENENFETNETGIAVILPQILGITNSSFEYNGNIQAIQFESSDLGWGKIEPAYFIDEHEAEAKNVGTYAVKFMFIQGENSIQIPYDETILTITKKQLTVSVKIDENVMTAFQNTYFHVYDKLLPTIGFVADGFVNDETFNFMLNYTRNENVGTYPISIVRVSDELSNYEVIYVDATLEITKRSLQIISSGGLSKEYGDVDPASFGFTVKSGLLDGDESAFSLVLSRQEGEDAGFYDITVQNFESQNYELSFISTKFQITKRFAIVTIYDATKVYDGAESGEKFDFVKLNSNVKEEDYETIRLAIVREVGKDVGTYKIYLDESKVVNYKFYSNSATLTITKKSVVVTADSITEIFGENKKLTFVADGLVPGEELSGELSRESGDDARLEPYKIFQGTLNDENNPNYEITFIGAELRILKRNIKVEPNSNQFKFYGDSEKLSYKTYFNGEEFECKLNGELSREAGENVGEYEILLGTLENSNPNFEIEFVGGVKFKIEKAKLSLVIDSQTKFYGELDAELTYTLNGLKNGEELKVLLTREAGENVGTYRIYLSNLNETEFQNYEITETIEGNYEILKANLNLVLSDESVIYNGIEQYISLDISSLGVDESKLKVTYVYSRKEVTPKNAGNYTVQLIFEGDENHNPFTSNEANFKILKKQVSVTLVELEFIYDGTLKLPKFTVNTEGINEDMIGINFTEKDAIEVGVYPFTLSIISEEKANYQILESNENYVVTIFSNYEKDSGNSKVLTENVSFANSNIEFVEIKNSTLKSKFSSSVNSRKCVSVYGFKNIDGYENSSEIIKVSIKALSKGKNVELYILSANGEMTPVNYEEIDGYYVLNISDLTSSILVTVVDKTSNYLKAGILVLVLFITYVATKNIKKRKIDKFFLKNTSKSTLSTKDFEKNKNIVSSVLVNDDVVDANSFLNKNE